MRLKLLACEILFREFCRYIAVSPNRIDVEFLPKGLHDLGRRQMQLKLQESLATVDTKQYDAILLGYALCSGGIVGLQAAEVPIVVPKAHDCITLFLGDRARYMEYFTTNPGTYFKTAGWIERGGDLLQYRADSIQDKSGMNMTLAQMVERYGEENALYLWEQLQRMTHYSQLTFIETGIEPDGSFEDDTRKVAEEKGWRFDKLQGDLSLIRRLLDGPWDNDFLIVPPGKTIEFDYSDEIVQIK